MQTREFVASATYALATLLKAGWMEARVTKVARVSPRFSKSSARHRFRPNQEKVRSRTAAEGLASRPSAQARPYAARPRSPRRPHYAGTCEGCCRPSTVAESRGGAGNPKDSVRNKHRIAFIAAASLYTLLQVLSVRLFEKLPLDQALTNAAAQRRYFANN
jgi:hypothetical protein